MKVVIPGGTGQVGTIVDRAAGGRPRGGDPDQATGAAGIALLGRDDRGGRVKAVDGSDVVINLAGRSVSCRYTQANLRELLAAGFEFEHARRPEAAADLVRRVRER